MEKILRSSPTKKKYKYKYKYINAKKLEPRKKKYIYIRKICQT